MDSVLYLKAIRGRYWQMIALLARPEYLFDVESKGSEAFLEWARAWGKRDSCGLCKMKASPEAKKKCFGCPLAFNRRDNGDGYFVQYGCVEQTYAEMYNALVDARIWLNGARDCGPYDDEYALASTVAAVIEDRIRFISEKIALHELQPPDYDREFLAYVAQDELYVHPDEWERVETLHGESQQSPFRVGGTI